MTNHFSPSDRVHMSSLDTPRTVIKTPLAPAAIGPYNQAILVGDTLYCSGQIPIDPKTGSLISGTIEQEAERVLENLGAVLRAAWTTRTSSAAPSICPT